MHTCRHTHTYTNNGSGTVLTDITTYFNMYIMNFSGFEVQCSSSVFLVRHQYLLWMPQPFSAEILYKNKLCVVCTESANIILYSLCVVCIEFAYMTLYSLCVVCTESVHITLYSLKNLWTTFNSDFS